MTVGALVDLGLPLAAPVKERALAVFARLAEAEGRVHGVPADAVQFHEVGALDAIVDVVGAALGFVHLGVEAVYAGPLPMGQGGVPSAHGPLPVPVPAVIELLAGRPVRLEDGARSEEHTSELQSQSNLVCRLLLEK